MNSGPVALVAEFTARPGDEALVAQLLAELARQVRSEPGNVAFDAYCRSDAPAKFVVHEIYRDQHAFEVHLQADYGAEFNRQLNGLIVEPHSVLTFLTPVVMA